MNDDKDPRSFNTPGRATLNNSDVGDVGMAVLSLAKELWLMRDRMAILEAVLAQKGIDVSQEIENFQPDPSMQAELDQQANAMITQLLATLKGN